MSDKRLAAFHEAGHAIATVTINPEALGLIVIEKTGDSWTGNTEVYRNKIPADKINWAIIGTAGLVAEAIGMANPNRQSSLAVVDDRNLFAQISDCYVRLLTGEQASGWRIDVTISDSTTINAWISIADILEMRRYQLDDDTIRQGLSHSIDLLNNKRSPLHLIADSLEQNQSVTIGHFMKWIIENK